MTVFGTTRDGMQIAQLVGLLGVLALWIVASRNVRDFERWFKGWSSRKPAKTPEKGGPSSHPPTGPWG
jgi:hypothetical protein